MSRFTIDGKDWEYRNPKGGFAYKNVDPDDPDQGTVKGPRTDGSENPHAYAFTNPLYDHDRKTVRKAGDALGIQNVDEKDEVKRILAFIDNDADEDKPNSDKEDKQEDPTPAPPSQQDIKADKLKQNKIDEIKTRMTEPSIDIYENYAGKDGLIARNASQSKVDPNFLDKYTFKSRQSAG